MQQYLDLCQRILDEGVWVENKRTGTRCLTVINADFEYDLSDGKVPAVTTKKLHWKPAIAEFLGYLRGYDSAAQFRAIGCNTWNANANENASWLANPHRQGADDMGRVYGVQGRRWVGPDGIVDQVRNVYEHLKNGIDDRGETITFWNPGEHHRGCLRPCMRNHTFSVLGDTLYLTSEQRSWDGPLGGPFNALQVAWFLLVMAQITGLKPGKAFHKIINAHIYENQVALMRDVQLTRKPLPLPTLKINPAIKTLEDLETWVTVDDFELVDYQSHAAINYPFSV